MVTVGVIRSRFPIMTHPMQRNAVKRVAKYGSLPSATLK